MEDRWPEPIYLVPQRDLGASCFDIIAELYPQPKVSLLLQAYSLSIILQTEQVLFFSFPLKLPVNSQSQKNMGCHVCRGSGIFRRRMESLFYTGFTSLCILLMALFLLCSLLTREKMPGAQQIKFLKTCSALGVTPQPFGPSSPLLFSVASLALA